MNETWSSETVILLLWSTADAGHKSTSARRVRNGQRLTTLQIILSGFGNLEPIQKRGGGSENPHGPMALASQLTFAMRCIRETAFLGAQHVLNDAETSS